jgi:hypothetical protein
VSVCRLRDVYLGRFGILLLVSSGDYARMAFIYIVKNVGCLVGDQFFKTTNCTICAV